MSSGRMIQLEGSPKDKKKEFWEGKRIMISGQATTALNIPSENGILTFYPTGKFAELGIEIWATAILRS
jgi:hypothetical protein